MNPVLEYATEHRAEACRFVAARRVPLDDSEDVVQAAMLRIIRVGPHDSNPRSYWGYTLRSAVCDYWKRRHFRPAYPFTYGEDGSLLTDMEDPRQDIERQAEALETAREAWDEATPSQREAITAALTMPVRCLPNRTKQGLHHLRRRLRAAVA